jgi:azurin
MNKLIQSVAALAVLAGVMLPAHAADKVCKLEISGNDLMQYDKKDLKVAADCTQVELTLTHAGKLPAQAMGHNWVLSKAADMNGIVSSGMKAGPDKSYVDPADKQVIAHTKLVGGGESASVTFPVSALKKGEQYQFFCTFPGHSALMKGTLTLG